MKYIHAIPDWPSFRGRGLCGYSFGPLEQRIDVYYVDVQSGHDTFLVSRKIARTYYVISGHGYFTIGGCRHDVSSGMLAEIPPGIEYTYSGKMQLLVFSSPRWFAGNDRLTRWNPDVIATPSNPIPRDRAWLSRLIQFKLLGKSPVGIFLRFNQYLWGRLPPRIACSGPLKAYGHLLHKLARAHGNREQASSTFFLRNRPLLQLINHLAERSGKAGELKVAVLGCSTGAEVYSIVWTLRSARPDLKLTVHAVDISRQNIEFAKSGLYLPASRPEASIFERMTDPELTAVFEEKADGLAIKPWLKEGIDWYVADAGDASITNRIGLHDIVVANNFLCHMDDSSAEACLRNIAQLVAPGGYLFVSGIDLDVRTRVARDLEWRVVDEMIEEVHEGDPCMRRLWPSHYCGLEPLDKKRRDWKLRYSAAFQLGAAMGAPHAQLATKQLAVVK